MTNKKAAKKGEEGESQVSAFLEQDQNYHRLINNLVLLGSNNVSHQIDHIFIRENGIFVIETKNYYGDIKGEEDNSFWTRSYFVKGKKKSVAFHNPLKQNQSHIRIIKKIIGKDYPIYCFVVFPQNNVDHLGIFNVCNLNTLLKRINIVSSETCINKDEIERVYNVLLSFEADVNNEEHVESVKKVEKERKEHQKQIRTAIEKRICPYCGNKLLFTKVGLVCQTCEKFIVKM